MQRQNQQRQSNGEEEEQESRNDLVQDKRYVNGTRWFVDESELNSRRCVTIVDDQQPGTSGSSNQVAVQQLPRRTGLDFDYEIELDNEQDIIFDVQSDNSGLSNQFVNALS